ncbi:MAG: T9SS type A sorting domain-containing protein, partial [Saprospiraceae bacterium]
YTVTRTWRADDLCGNTATTTQVITVLGSSYGEEGSENRMQHAGHPQESPLRVHPNPTTDRIWVDLSAFADQAVTVSIFSDLGQLVWENRIPAVEELKLQVSLLEAGAKAGVYTISVRSASGVAAKRVVLVE